jgi:hypothetical protein
MVGPDAGVHRRWRIQNGETALAFDLREFRNRLVRQEKLHHRVV